MLEAGIGIDAPNMRRGIYPELSAASILPMPMSTLVMTILALNLAPVMLQNVSDKCFGSPRSSGAYTYNYDKK